MVISWYEEVKKFKSPLSVIAAFLLKSRETQLAENRRLKEQVIQLAEQHNRDLREQALQQRKLVELTQRCAELEKERDKARQSVNLPADPPLGTHGYGARMVSLAVNLARSIGLRGAERVLQLFFKWLNVPGRTPTRTAIRSWLQRLGIDELNQPLDANEEVVVLVDHSNQIGTEKVLAVLGVNTSELPEQGETLTHQHVRVLQLKPGSQWKTEDMEQEYQDLAARFGPLRAVVTDGAIELRDGVKCLQESGSGTLVLRDLKHFAANVMKSLIGNDERFKEVSSQIGATRSAIQQTELAHLIPPGARPKARFMNLAATIRWMVLVVWLLKHPEAKGREGISEERMQAKLGWVAQYADDIAVWQECQDVVSKSLTFINEQYLHRGASEALSSLLGNSLTHAKSRELAQRLIDFVRDAEQQLREGERLPMSTEILESAFGIYKQLEGQQSKSGFTSLLACFPALLKPTTADSVTAAFQCTSSKDVADWVKQHFRSTVTSRRQAAIAEHKAARKRATTCPAMT